MKSALYKSNREILLELKKQYLNNTKRISETIPDLSIDISQINISEDGRKLLGPSMFYLFQKGFIDLTNRRVTITPKGIEELEPFFQKYKLEVSLAIFSGLVGIFGTIIGVVLTLIYSK